jgi:hypothetical protein
MQLKNEKLWFSSGLINGQWTNGTATETFDVISEFSQRCLVSGNDISMTD